MMEVVLNKEAFTDGKDSQMFKEILRLQEQVDTLLKQREMLQKELLKCHKTKGA